MTNNVREKLRRVRDEIDSLLNEEKYEEKYELKYIDTFYTDKGKYELYLFPESTEKYLNWYEAMEYAEGLNGDLPTMAELRYLCDNHSELFTSTDYWSSTEDDSNNAKVLDFYNGSTANYYKTATSYVRVIKRVYL